MTYDLSKINAENYPLLLEALIKKKLTEDGGLQIGLQEFNRQISSIITWNEYSSDENIHLKYNGQFIFEIDYFDENDDQTSKEWVLNSDDLLSVPGGLQNLLIEAYTHEKTMTFLNNSLTG